MTGRPRRRQRLRLCLITVFNLDSGTFKEVIERLKRVSPLSDAIAAATGRTNPGEGKHHTLHRTRKGDEEAAGFLFLVVGKAEMSTVFEPHEDDRVILQPFALVRGH